MICRYGKHGDGGTWNDQSVRTELEEFYDLFLCLEGLWLGDSENERCRCGQPGFPHCSSHSTACNGEFLLVRLSHQTWNPICVVSLMSAVPSTVPDTQKSSVFICWMNVNEWINAWMNSCPQCSEESSSWESVRPSIHPHVHSILTKQDTVCKMPCR